MDKKLRLGPGDVDRWTYHCESWYRFTLVQRYMASRGMTVKKAIDVGVNLGITSAIMTRVFKEAQVIGFEVVPKYFDLAVENLKRCGAHAEVRRQAITGQHLYEDDLCTKSLSEPRVLTLLLATGSPEGGDGWIGGSRVEGAAGGGPDADLHWYDPQQIDMAPIELREVVGSLLKDSEDMIDFIKLDCEGCEYTSLSNLKELAPRVRFMAGEYHDSNRFFPVVKELEKTHKVWLSGHHICGGFFCELRDDHSNPLLLKERSEKTIRYGRRRQEANDLIYPEPVDWNVWNPRWVPAPDLQDGRYL